MTKKIIKKLFNIIYIYFNFNSNKLINTPTKNNPILEKIMEYNYLTLNNKYI